MIWSMLGRRFIFLSLTALIGFFLILCVGSVSYAASDETASQQEPAKPDIQNATCVGANLRYTSEPNSNECTFNGLQATEKLNNIISEVINFFSVIIGVVAVLMIIVGGFRYIISGGDSGNVTSAKNTILYAIIGLLIVVFAQFIVKFILSKAVDIAN